MAKKKVYYRVSIFALGDGGGNWEEDEIFLSGFSPEAAYNRCLDYLREKGFAFESKIEQCDKDGDILQ